MYIRRTVRPSMSEEYFSSFGFKLYGDNSGCIIPYPVNRYTVEMVKMIANYHDIEIPSNIKDDIVMSTLIYDLRKPHVNILTSKFTFNLISAFETYNPLHCCRIVTIEGIINTMKRTAQPKANPKHCCCCSCCDNKMAELISH